MRPDLSEQKVEAQAALVDSLARMQLVAAFVARHIEVLLSLLDPVEVFVEVDNPEEGSCILLRSTRHFRDVSQAVGRYIGDFEVDRERVADSLNVAVTRRVVVVEAVVLFADCREREVTAGVIER